MPSNEYEVVIVGGGAAGIGAARRLHEARVSYRLVEARARLGGRAYTLADGNGHALDHGCGWLHSADRNPWTGIAAAQGKTIDKTRPPWERPGPEHIFSAAQHKEFWGALRDTFKAAKAAAQGPDRALADLLPTGGKWNAALNAASTYISGAELDCISVHDTDRYHDTGVNWRIVEGYGAAIAAHGAELNVTLDCPVTRIDHGGARIRIETANGAILADQVIVTLPTSLLENERLFSPALPGKADAARGLPLGIADKLFLSLDNAEEFEADLRIFGRIDRAGTGTYHFRPFGRPMIEVYFGGRCAEELEAGGERAFMDFAIAELTGVFGGDFARRVSLIHVHRWRADPFARGSYSYALPGHADDRAVLAAPVDGRLYFAGEACSPADFSTAHGAFATGIAAAEQVLELRRERV